MCLIQIYIYKNIYEEHNSKKKWVHEINISNKPQYKQIYSYFRKKER